MPQKRSMEASFVNIILRKIGFPNGSKITILYYVKIKEDNEYGY